MSLTEGLQQYQQGFRDGQEAAAKGMSANGSTDAALDLMLNQALKTHAELLVAGDSDTVRLNAVKLVYAYRLGIPGAATGKDNEITDLLKKLQSNDPKNITELAPEGY